MKKSKSLFSVHQRRLEPQCGARGRQVKSAPTFGAPAALGIFLLECLEEFPTSTPMCVRQGRQGFDAVQHHDCHPSSESSSGSGEASSDAQGVLPALTRPSPEPV